MATLKVEFPKGKIYLDDNNQSYIEYNQNYVNKFNNNLNLTQVFLDKTVAQNLMKYVSLRTGVQEKSIQIASNYGSGIVTIGVPYAEYQAYSKKIKKRVGLRGTYPWERMVKEKKESILKQVANYSRRINNG